jgi:D-arabinose 1-dehydrogenase-like Zn-dependent alcohol dehydrogenase
MFARATYRRAGKANGLASRRHNPTTVDRRGAPMRTAQYTRAGQVDVGDAHPSPPGLGEVSIAVAFVGLCGTDLHIVHGDMDARVTIPHTFGHEMSGTIAR